jgi:hypothetical protein
MKKEELINQIIEDLKQNFYESQEYIFDLVKEALIKRSIKELKEINA